MILAIGNSYTNGSDKLAEYLRDHYGFGIVRFDEGIVPEMLGWRLMYRIGTGELEITRSGERSRGVGGGNDIADFLRTHGERRGEYYAYTISDWPPAEILLWWRKNAASGMDTVNHLPVSLPAKTVIPDLFSREEFDFLREKRAKIFNIENWVENPRPLHPLETVLSEGDFDRVFVNDNTAKYIQDIVLALNLRKEQRDNDGYTGGEKAGEGAREGSEERGARSDDDRGGWDGDDGGGGNENNTPPAPLGRGEGGRKRRGKKNKAALLG